MSTVQVRHDGSVRDRAFALRAEKKSLDEIARELSVSKSTVYYWLTVVKPSPLSAAEQKRRRQARDRTFSDNAAARRLLGQSKHHKVVGQTKLSLASKCAIAEAAILFRLALRGYRVFKSIFDGDKVDWLIGAVDGVRFKRVQVKWMGRGKYGRPACRMTCIGDNRRRKYTDGEIDLVIGYDLYTDTAYMFGPADFKAHTMMSARDSAAEQWDLLRD